MFHPATEPGRHPRAAEHTMRNRVWLAHRNLPAGLAVLYVLDWLAISAARDPRHGAALSAPRSRRGGHAPGRGGRSGGRPLPGSPGSDVRRVV